MKRTLYTMNLAHFMSKMMRAIILLCVFNLFSAVTVQAQEAIIDQDGGRLQIVKEMPVGQQNNLSSQSVQTVDPNAIYSNVTTFLGSALQNGGSATASGNTITRLVADSLGLVGTPPFSVVGFTFSVANLNTVAVSARPRIRFYKNDNLAGGPGTYITGYSYSAISFNAGSAITLNTTSTVTIPDNNVWAAITFDNNTGATGATIAQMDLLGQGLYGPVDRGSSTDGFYLTTAAGSFTTSNPTAAFTYFGGTTAANFGWELRVAATVPVELMGFTARPNQKTTQLEWQTASENNNKGFQIERQTSAHAPWEAIGFVAGNGKGSKYEFIDNTPLSINYYRLRQMDNDGAFKFSKVVSVSFKGEKSLTVYPSIVSDGYLTVETTETNDFAIFNTLGQQMMRGKSTQSINVSSLLQGTYVLKIGEVQTKFIKQ